MAVIWEKKHVDTATERSTRYQVRQAGASVRLYTNDVFHSQWNPRSPISGSIWDLLMLPTFLSPNVEKLNNILVLGIGGGAVINTINHFFSPAHIDGIDLDPVHIQIAKRFFNVKKKNVTLEEGDAVDWVKKGNVKKYDVIIEDLFGESSITGEAVRAIPANELWFEALISRLSKSGTLLMNFESIKQCRKSESVNAAKRLVSEGKLKSVWVLQNEKYENALAVFTRSSVSREEFYSRLEEYPQLDRSRKSCKLSFTLREIRP